jgi:hypothetical protein
MRSLEGEIFKPQSTQSCAKVFEGIDKSMNMLVDKIIKINLCVSLRALRLNFARQRQGIQCCV